MDASPELISNRLSNKWHTWHSWKKPNFINQEVHNYNFKMAPNHPRHPYLREPIQAPRQNHHQHLSGKYNPTPHHQLILLFCILDVFCPWSGVVDCYRSMRSFERLTLNVRSKIQDWLHFESSYRVARVRRRYAREVRYQEGWRVLDGPRFELDISLTIYQEALGIPMSSALSRSLGTSD